MERYKTRLTEDSSPVEVFQVINTRQIEALMFHDQMADLFDFLGLMGFKRMHEYQYLSESAEHRALKRYYLNHHNKLLPSLEVDSPHEIPDDWYKYTRFDVTTQVRKQAIEKAFENYNNWEAETKALYEEGAKILFDHGCIADFCKIKSLVCDVDQELKSLDRLYLTLRATGYNEVYIASIQDGLHECYREKSKSIGIDIC
jgi:hypothetical protein